jgi:centromere/kinetochore protein ZW10
MVSDRELSKALIASIRYGSYPESEEVISSDITSSALPIVLEQLKVAKDDLHVRKCVPLPKITC